MEDVDRRMRDADRKIRDLDSRLDDLESDQQRLSDKFGYTEDLDHELGSLRDSISGCDDKIEELDQELRDRVDDTDQTVKRLVQQVRLLEGLLKASGKAQSADLDTVTEDLRSLARSMQRGWQARRLLLSNHERTTFQQRIRHHRATTQQHRTHRATVIDTVGTLIATRYGSRAHAQAAQELREALAREEQLRQSLERQTKPAEEAQDALAADEKTRTDNEAVMAEGTRAEKRLTWALRSRLADAVSDRALLPTWFVTVLGSAPPAIGTQTWLDTATQVLLYRLTYDVTDQVVALGSKPSDADGHRREWYEKLVKELRRW
ncbi:hypothetical protein [Streptomyces sp. HUAS ZL42]|uniref:hypothetical protein n=1 Tax=Streptomyces sp. HUAS ZL42 TaxID=3231715 RepID=UPI00345ED551